jgi:hypothetical protein
LPSPAGCVAAMPERAHAKRLLGDNLFASGEE